MMDNKAPALKRTEDTTVAPVFLARAATLGCCDALADCAEDTAAAPPTTTTERKIGGGGGSTFPAMEALSLDISLVKTFYQMKDQLLASTTAATNPSVGGAERDAILARAQRMKDALAEKYGTAALGKVRGEASALHRDSTSSTADDTWGTARTEGDNAKAAPAAAEGGGAIGESTSLSSAAGRPLCPDSSVDEQQTLVEQQKRASSSSSSNLRMTRDDFEALAVVGRGAFGEVRVVRSRGDGALYALKAMSKDAMIKKNQVCPQRQQQQHCPLPLTDEWIAMLTHYE